MEEKQLPIEKQWLIKINQELKELPDGAAESTRWSKRSIYKIPASVTDLNKRAYKPQIVSIGPYHHGLEYLKAMEEHKHRALLHFLKRSNKCLETLIEVLTPVVKDVKDAYDQLDSKWHQNTSKFLEMMIRDGCFILEILQTTSKKQPKEGADSKKQQNEAADNASKKKQNEVADSKKQQNEAADNASEKNQNEAADHDDYAHNDPIFGHHGKLYIVPYLKRDMLMLENQIPMLVLEKLASIQKDDPLQRDKGYLTKLILNFFSQGKATKHMEQFQQCLHILDVHRRSLLLEEPKSRQKKDPVVQPEDRWGLARFLGSDKHRGEEIIRSATELKEAGISIKSSKSRSLKDISFRHGVLKLPLIVVDDALESLYLNLIAFERFHVGAGNEVTSYVFFMDNIIDNAMDVSLLHSCGIIQNALGSDKAVASLFNSLSREATLDPDSSLDKVHKRVSAYCQKPWHQWKANLKHNYFTNPWISLSVLAAIFLFALTILQTVYSVLAYVKPPPNAG